MYVHKCLGYVLECSGFFFNKINYKMFQTLFGVVGTMQREETRGAGASLQKMTRSHQSKDSPCIWMGVLDLGGRACMHLYRFMTFI